MAKKATKKKAGRPKGVVSRDMLDRSLLRVIKECQKALDLRQQYVKQSK